jgi:PmbA protein
MGREPAPNLDVPVAGAVEYAVRMLDAAPIPSGKMPAVFRYDAMADLLGWFSSVFSAEAAQKGLSLLKGREGEIIAAPCLTLTDDPLLPGGLSSRAFDDEGVATYTKRIIDGGKLTTLLHNLKTARVQGVSSTGNAAKASYASPVRVAPSNLFISPGDRTLDELLRELSEGLLVTEVAGLHAGANGVSGDFSLSAKGFTVRGGVMNRAVEQITVAGNFFTLLQSIEAIGSDLHFGMSDAGSPSVRVAEISVAGT